MSEFQERLDALMEHHRHILDRLRVVVDTSDTVGTPDQSLAPVTLEEFDEIARAVGYVKDDPMAWSEHLKRSVRTWVEQSRSEALRWALTKECGTCDDGTGIVTDPLIPHRTWDCPDCTDGRVLRDGVNYTNVYGHRSLYIVIPAEMIEADDVADTAAVRYTNTERKEQT